MYSGFVEGRSCVNETFLLGQVVREMWKALVLREHMLMRWIFERLD
jgi:hypothetical protein